MIEQLQNAAWNRIQNVQRRRKTAQAGAPAKTDQPKIARDRDRADPGAEDRLADVRSRAGIIDYEA